MSSRDQTWLSRQVWQAPSHSAILPGWRDFWNTPWKISPVKATHLRSGKNGRVTDLCRKATQKKKTLGLLTQVWSLRQDVHKAAEWSQAGALALASPLYLLRRDLTEPSVALNIFYSWGWSWGLDGPASVSWATMSAVSKSALCTCFSLSHTSSLGAKDTGLNKKSAHV